MRKARMLLIALVAVVCTGGLFLATTGPERIAQDGPVVPVAPEIAAPARSVTTDERACGELNDEFTSLSLDERFDLSAAKGLIWTPDATATGGINDSCPATQKCANRPYCYPAGCSWIDTGMVGCGGIGGTSCQKGQTIHIQRCTHCEDPFNDPPFLCGNYPIDVAFECQ